MTLSKCRFLLNFIDYSWFFTNYRNFQRLRTENRLLRQRIDYLEAESSALADRLVKGQVTARQESSKLEQTIQVNLAKEAENCINIAHELSKLRDINSDAHKKLEDAYETIRSFFKIYHLRYDSENE